MTSFGVVPTGFAPKQQADVIADLEEGNRNAFGQGINQSATSVFGNINGTYSLPVAIVWEALQAVYRARDPNSAEGDALDIIAALTGVTRLDARKGTVTLTVNLNAAITLPAGRVVSAAGNPAARFVTLADVTSVGAGDYQVEAEAETAGAFTAIAGSLTVIETPVGGWNSVTNAADAEPGRDRETDSQLRIRREALLRVTGSATVEAIRADVLDVEDVEEVIVFENTSDVTDGDGIPPHSFEVVVLGGDNTDIAQAIWESRPVGIPSHGSITANATDSLGNTRPVKFSRPDVLDIYIEITVETGAGFPVDGEDRIKQAIVDANSGRKTGQDVIYRTLDAPVIPQPQLGIAGVPGVVDVTALTVGTSPGPVGTSNIAVGTRELADFDTSRINVTVV